MANLKSPQVESGAPAITVRFWCHTIDETSPEEFAPEDTGNAREEESRAHRRFAEKVTAYVQKLLFENTGEPAGGGNRRKVAERELTWRIIAGICQNENSRNYDQSDFATLYHILSETASFLKTMLSQGPRLYYEQQKRRKLVVNESPFWAGEGRIEISAQEKAKNNFGGRAAMTSTTESVEAGYIIPALILTPTTDSQDTGQVHQPIMALLFDHLYILFGDKYTHLRHILREENGPVKNTIPLDRSLRLQYDAGRVFLRSIKSNEPNRQYLQFLRTAPRDPLRLESSNEIWDSSRTLDDEELDGGLIDTVSRGGKRGPHFIRHGDVFYMESRDPEEFPFPSHEIMELWLGLSRITHNVRAKSALEHLFRDPAPDLDEETISARTDEALQSTFAPLILLAEKERILDAEKATRWLLAMGQHEAKRLQEELRIKQLEEEEWAAAENPRLYAASVTAPGTEAWRFATPKTWIPEAPVGLHAIT
ncbi:hypothetical protein PG984_008576 [Apiospora sp. TS-2023a]